MQISMKTSVGIWKYSDGHSYTITNHIKMQHKLANSIYLPTPPLKLATRHIRKNDVVVDTAVNVWILLREHTLPI